MPTLVNTVINFEMNHLHLDVVDCILNVSMICFLVVLKGLYRKLQDTLEG